ncbi:MAPEG family protein [Erythrobacter sp. JK5]|nr:MAPEG family protein [Erythrobacter sp. JK5]QUL39309.1 MAPEG family protein [Erythrobacter sp. JK5]
MLLPVTLAAAAAAAILNVWLMVRVGRVRAAEKIFVGDEDNVNVIRRMRAHANFTENAPFVLILLAVIELSGRGDPWLAYVAGLFILGRVAHGFGMDGGALAKGRMIGTIISMLTLLGLAVVAVLIGLGVM